jgi:hypothetical protein
MEAVWMRAPFLKMARGHEHQSATHVKPLGCDPDTAGGIMMRADAFFNILRRRPNW